MITPRINPALWLSARPCGLDLEVNSNFIAFVNQVVFLFLCETILQKLIPDYVS